MRAKVLSLFSGCGGLDYGFENHDAYEVVRAYDSDQYAVDTYNLNYPGNKAEVMDVSRLTSPDFELGFKPQVIIGGPPCQDFSLAGNKQLGERANMTSVYCDLICKYRPNIFVMENVTNITSIGRVIFQEIKRRFSEHGYGLTISKINMWEYGVPQTRTRLFIIGKQGGADDEFLKTLELAKNPVGSMREYLENHRPDVDMGGKEHVWFSPRHYRDKSTFSLDSLAPTQRTSKTPMPPTYVFNDKDSTRDMEKVYTSTYEFSSLLQTFPQSWKFPREVKIHNHRVIGNAVPPLLSKVLSNILMKTPMRALGESKTKLRFAIFSQKINKYTM